MSELFRQIIIALRGMWRYRWFGLITTWIVGAIGVVTVMSIPDMFEASTRIYVNTASILKPLMSGMTVQPNDDQRIAMLSRLVISRPNVEKLIQTVGLDANIKTKDDYERQVDGVLKALEIKSAGRDNLYTLTYKDRDPNRGKRVIQQFSSMFIESGHDGKINDADAAKKFIEDQILVYEKKLQEAESRLKEFKVRSLDAAGGQGRDYFARMTETTAALEKAQLDLREAENTRDAFRRGLASEEPASSTSTAVSTGLAVADVDARIAAMKRNLDTLLQKYTDNHPDVIGAQRVIGDLESQRSQIVVAGRRDGIGTAPTVAASGPRASEQLKVSLAGAEASVASLRARVAEYSERFRRLKAAATMMPQLEAEFAQLNRDYDVNKKNYESLVSRRESASISSEMQSVAGVADFRLIDPPRVSPRPVSPNRAILLPTALLIALCAGFAVTFVSFELRPTFFDGRALSEVSGLPILGTVSMLLSPSKRAEATKGMIRFLGGVGLMLGTYGAALIAMAMMSTRST